MKKKYKEALQAHFDAPSCEVLNFADHAASILEIFGYAVKKVTLARLSGAPTGSVLRLTLVDDTLHPAGTDDPPAKTERTPAGLMVEISNPKYLTESNFVIFYKSSKEERGIYIKLVMFRKGMANAIGGLMIRAILDGVDVLNKRSRFVQLVLLGAGGRIWGDMAGGRRWSGYKSWPKYGFNMEIHEETLGMFKHFPKHPKNLNACITLRDLLGLEGGPEFWAAVGDGYYMHFDISDTDAIATLERELQLRFI